MVRIRHKRGTHNCHSLFFVFFSQNGLKWRCILRVVRPVFRNIQPLPSSSLHYSLTKSSHPYGISIINSTFAFLYSPIHPSTFLEHPPSQWLLSNITSIAFFNSANTKSCSPQRVLTRASRRLRSCNAQRPSTGSKSQSYQITSVNVICPSKPRYLRQGQTRRDLTRSFLTTT